MLWLLDIVFLRWTTAYGVSIARLFATWLVVLAGFGAVFSALPQHLGRPSAKIWSAHNWAAGFGQSAAAFTLGLDRANEGLATIGTVLTSIESLLGAVLIVLAVVVMVRRFTRQG
jgi:hypothetical protein